MFQFINKIFSFFSRKGKKALKHDKRLRLTSRAVQIEEEFTFSENEDEYDDSDFASLSSDETQQCDEWNKKTDVNKQLVRYKPKIKITKKCRTTKAMNSASKRKGKLTTCVTLKKGIVKRRKPSRGSLRPKTLTDKSKKSIPIKRSKIASKRNNIKGIEMVKGCSSKYKNRVNQKRANVKDIPKVKQYISTKKEKDIDGECGKKVECCENEENQMIKKFIKTSASSSSTKSKTPAVVPNSLPLENEVKMRRITRRPSLIAKYKTQIPIKSKRSKTKLNGNNIKVSETAKRCKENNKNRVMEKSGNVGGFKMIEEILSKDKNQTSEENKDTKTYKSDQNKDQEKQESNSSEDSKNVKPLSTCNDEPKNNKCIKTDVDGESDKMFECCENEKDQLLKKFFESEVFSSIKSTSSLPALTCAPLKDGLVDGQFPLRRSERLLRKSISENKVTIKRLKGRSNRKNIKAIEVVKKLSSITQNQVKQKCSNVGDNEIGEQCSNIKKEQLEEQPTNNGDGDKMLNYCENERDQLIKKFFEAEPLSSIKSTTSLPAKTCRSLENGLITRRQSLRLLNKVITEYPVIGKGFNNKLKRNNIIGGTRNDKYQAMRLCNDPEQCENTKVFEKSEKFTGNGIDLKTEDCKKVTQCCSNNYKDQVVEQDINTAGGKGVDRCENAKEQTIKQHNKIDASNGLLKCSSDTANPLPASTSISTKYGTVDENAKTTVITNSRNKLKRPATGDCNPVGKKLCVS